MVPNIRGLRMLALTAMAALMAPLPTSAQAPELPATVTATLDAASTSMPVSHYEYGMFIEPIRRLVDRSLWAEMLDDRKFFYPVEANAASGPNGRRWVPVGDPAAVVMDRDHPYVGEHSPRISLARAERRGLVQSGLGVVRGKVYSGRIVLKGAAGANVAVTLAWGDTAGDRETVPVTVTGKWQTVPLRFVAGADTDGARLEIAGTGTGWFEVGAVSLMPADNIDGWRADAVAAQRQLKSGMWRLPGGNFLSGWDWHDAIGPRDLRPPVMDAAWGAMQSNDIGMDDWMTLCRLIGVEPYVTVNAGFGDANSAAEEVEYLNGAPNTYWGAKRAANGHPNPYGVKYFNIGNEPYGDWQLGQTTVAYFAMKHIDFARRMRKVDPSIILLASGAMPDQRHWPEASAHKESDLMGKFGSEIDWTGGMLAKATPWFDGVTEHWYSRGQDRKGMPPAEELLAFARQPSNDVHMKVFEWGIYRAKFPDLDKRGVFLSIDEYAYTGGGANLKSALAYGMVLNEMLRNSDHIRMGAFTSGAGVMDTTPTGARLNTTGKVFELYGQHFGEGVTPIKVEGATPWPVPAGADGKPVIQGVAGSPTWPLDVTAGLAPGGGTLVVAVVNATTSDRTLTLALRGVTSPGPGKAWILTGPSLDSANTVKAGEQVSIRAAATPPLAGGIVVPAKAVVIYEFPAGR